MSSLQPTQSTNGSTNLTTFNSILTEAKKDDLDYDPFHAIVRLAILNLVASEAKKEGSEIKFSVTIKNNKFCFNRSDSLLYKNFIYDASKRFFYQDPEQLYSLRRHITKALSWFPPEADASYRLIYQEASKALTYLIESTKQEFKSRLKDDQILIEKAIEKGTKSLEEIPCKISDLREKKELNGYKFTIEEQREIVLYQKYAHLWNARVAQTIHNLIADKDVDTLRELARNNLKKYLEIKQ